VFVGYGEKFFIFSKMRKFLLAHFLFSPLIYQGVCLSSVIRPCGQKMEDGSPWRSLPAEGGAGFFMRILLKISSPRSRREKGVERKGSK